MVHHLIRAPESGGETAAAALVAKLGSRQAKTARELAYRVYTLCERKKRVAEAFAYNGLVQTGPRSPGWRGSAGWPRQPAVSICSNRGRDPWPSLTLSALARPLGGTIGLEFG